jgi:glutaredoxin
MSSEVWRRRLPEPRVRIAIVSDTSSSQACAAKCGIDWSKPEILGAARQQVVERFGDTASLEYVDLPKSGNTAAVKKMKSAVKGMPLPVLLANGRPHIAGQFDLRQVMDVIEAALEAEL